jgi:acetolactate synthase-1/2/3 large subunit
VAICGGGPVIAGAFAELERLAGLIELPIATTVSGQGAIAETDPLAVGVVGSNGGNRATRAVVDGADVVLFIGCRAGSVTTERWRSPGTDKTIIHIDSDAMVIGANYLTAVAICADARLALAALADALEAETGLTAQDGVRRAKAAWDAKLARFCAAGCEQ